MPYLSASAVVIHYEEALYQVYAPLPFKLYLLVIRPNQQLSVGRLCSPSEGNEIETVDNWRHLGHVISSNMHDAMGIARRRHEIIGQVNDVVCTLSTADPITKITLLRYLNVILFKFIWI